MEYFLKIQFPIDVSCEKWLTKSINCIDWVLSFFRQISKGGWIFFKNKHWRICRCRYRYCWMSKEISYCFRYSMFSSAYCRCTYNKNFLLIFLLFYIKNSHCSIIQDCYSVLNNLIINSKDCIIPVKNDYLRWNIRNRLFDGVGKGDPVELDESLRKPRSKSNDEIMKSNNLRWKKRICWVDDDVGRRAKYNDLINSI